MTKSTSTPLLNWRRPLTSLSNTRVPTPCVLWNSPTKSRSIFCWQVGIAGRGAPQRGCTILVKRQWKEAAPHFAKTAYPVIGEQDAARVGADRATTLLVRWHHEWWNGSGYPDGLRGDEIPLAGRILRLADSYVSLTASRPFRAAHSAAVARQMIIERAGIEFDPRVVQTLLQLELTDHVEPAEAVEPVKTGYESKELFSSFTK